jgi:hypothetical protein
MDELSKIQDPLRLPHMSHTGYNRTQVSFPLYREILYDAGTELYCGIAYE